MYIVDQNNHCVRKITVSTGIITTITGTGTSSYSGDNGPATSAALDDPYEVALDASGRTTNLLALPIDECFIVFITRQRVHR